MGLYRRSDAIGIEEWGGGGPKYRSSETKYGGKFRGDLRGSERLGRWEDSKRKSVGKACLKLPKNKELLTPRIGGG